MFVNPVAEDGRRVANGRANVKAGHIPGVINVDMRSLLDAIGRFPADPATRMITDGGGSLRRLLPDQARIFERGGKRGLAAGVGGRPLQPAGVRPRLGTARFAKPVGNMPR